MGDIKNNKEEIITLLKSVKRNGMEQLINWLENSDYFTAPAANNHHCNYDGGLAQHSKNVYRLFKDNCKRHETKVNLSEDSIILIALLHDVCKVDYYKKVEKPRKEESICKDWVLIDMYDVVDEFPMGHGEKSVDIIRNFINLSDEEKLCIRWHMGPYEGEMKWRDFDNACKKYPSVYLAHISDCTASKLYEEGLSIEDKIKKSVKEKRWAFKR